MKLITVSSKDVAHLLQATFPDYRKKKAIIVPSTEVGLHGLNWEGGSRAMYRACTLSGNATGGADSFHALAPWANPAEGAKLPIPPGMVVVEAGTFCGKPATARVYVNPADMPKFLTAPDPVLAIA